MVYNAQENIQEPSLVERIGNLYAGIQGTEKSNELPECGIGNLCCHSDGSPRIVVMGSDNDETRSFYERTLEASDRCTTSFLVELSFDTDFSCASEYTPPILIIKGRVVHEGTNLSVEEIDALLAKAGFEERMEV